MNILHVLSQKEVTGAEVYAAVLADSQIQNGHNVYIISDTFSSACKAQIINLQIDKRDLFQRYKNLKDIKKIIKQYDIDIVHSHSRAASWVSHFATKKSNIPHISTIHGRQHIHASVKLMNIYGDKTIAVCENLKSHLIKELKFEDKQISVLPNCIDISKFDNLEMNLKKEGENNNTVISYIGRFSGPKGEIPKLFLNSLAESLLKTNPNLEINLIGKNYDELEENLKEKIVNLEVKFKERFRFLGFKQNLIETFRKTDLIIGSGRVAIESLAVGKQVYAIGENINHSFVSKANIEECFASNFGDISEFYDEKELCSKLNFVKMADEMQYYINNIDKIKVEQEIVDLVKQKYDSNVIHNQIMEIYKSERMKKVQKKYFPILMYHKVLDKEIDTKHQIYVTKDKFEKHLKYFKKSGFQSITLEEYEDFREGKIPLSKFPKKPLMLTFDDGFENNYTNLFPLLLKYNYKASIFILGDRKIEYNYWDSENKNDIEKLLKTEQILEMHNKGIDFQSHTMTHPNLVDMNVDEIKNEIANSKISIEKLLNKKIVAFAYPYGNINENIKKLTSEIGYKYAISTDTGALHLEEDRYQIFRVNMFPNETLFSLYKKTSSWYRNYYFKKRGK